MSIDLRDRLEKTARRLKRGKNSLITEALEEYLGRVSRTGFLDEARRQSILASASPTEEQEIWLERAADTSGWK